MATGTRRMGGWGWALALGIVASGASGQGAPPNSALARMPVREVTVFKDGHALVLHEGRMPTDAAGHVLLDYLPSPVLGTFWPYCREAGVKLSAVTASPRRVSVERTALALRELIEANAGADVIVIRTDGKPLSGKIVGVPTRTSEELAASDPPGTAERLPEKGSVLLLQTAEGTAAIGFDTIRDAVFRTAIQPKLRSEEFRNLLTLALDWGGRPVGKSAEVGMVYLQKGLRWIPSYRLEIDGKGTAHVRLQATLINELTDLKDVTANLVIGVPAFAFADTPDPIGLQQAVAQLGAYFQADAKTGYALSNAIMSQAARGGEFRGGGFGGMAGAPAAPPDLGPEVAGGGKSEDLFVFTVKHITLKRGSRMVVPVADYDLKYKDIYTVDIPFAPPAFARPTVATEQQAELARLLKSPKATHKLRLVNDGHAPLTTAPALICLGDRVLGQGLMTYTSIGGSVDLSITTATDIQVKRTDKEIQRTPNAVEWRSNHYYRADLQGVLEITNRKTSAALVEVNRYVVGNVDRVEHGGSMQMLNVQEDLEVGAGGGPGDTWRWYSWPDWWTRFNGMGRFTWRVTIEPGKTASLGYAWHYFGE